MQSVGGGFTVENTKSAPRMRFYVSGRTGKEQLDGNASMGVAELRRDGFTSVSATTGHTGVLTTRPVVFAAGRTMLFVNIEADDPSKLKVAILDAKTLMPLQGLAEASPQAEGERVPIVGFDAGSIASVAARSVRVRFTFESAALRLYSFWFAKDACGASTGWVAAGGVGFNSSRDWVGSCI